jgi:hypothetical protein
MFAIRPTAWVMAISLTIAAPAFAQQPAPSNNKDLAAYAGLYELAPGAVLTVTAEGQHLFAQLSGQDKFEIFPAGPNEFAWKVVDAKVTFERAPDGHATGLVLHQNGADIPAKRGN